MRTSLRVLGMLAVAGAVVLAATPARADDFGVRVAGGVAGAGAGLVEDRSR